MVGPTARQTAIMLVSVIVAKEGSSANWVRSTRTCPLEIFHHAATSPKEKKPTTIGLTFSARIRQGLPEPRNR